MIRMCAVRAALITHNAHMRLSVVAPLLAAALGHSHPHSHSLPPHSHQPQPRARTAPARSRVPTSRHGLAHPDAPPTQCSPEAEVDRAAASLPFTAHPPRPNSMYRPFEHKSGAATLQLIRGARLAPRLSGAAICGGAGCNATRYLPIWFALPSLRAFEAVRRETGGAPCGKKPHDFAPVVPDRRETYRFFTERECVPARARTPACLLVGSGAPACPHPRAHRPLRPRPLTAGTTRSTRRASTGSRRPRRGSTPSDTTRSSRRGLSPSLSAGPT